MIITVLRFVVITSINYMVSEIILTFEVMESDSIKPKMEAYFLCLKMRVYIFAVQCLPDTT